MLQTLIILLSLFLINSGCIAIDLTKEETANSTLPVRITVRSLADIKVRENQRIRLGQILAPRPPESETPTGYISQAPERAVQKQKQLLAEIRQVVEEEDLPEIIIQHEEAKLKDLEFAAKEHKLLSNQPKAFKETVYKSPVNGTVRRITPISSSDGLLTVELLVELD